MGQDDKIPTFSTELIEKLNNETPVPSLPFTVRGWEGLTEAKTRQLAFQSGMRAIVDMLVAWSREEDNDDVEDTGSDGERWPTGRVIDSFGKHREVVALDLAGHLSPPEPHPGASSEE